MLEVVEVTYLQNIEYIYDGADLVGVRHIDTGVIIPDEDGPYTEEELRDLLSTRTPERLA